MPSKNLTSKSIERIAKPRTGRTEVSDIEKGLFLHIKPTGVRSWIVVYRVRDVSAGGRAGHRVKLKIGNWPTMNVEEARAEARRISELAVAGIDPKEQLAQAKWIRDQNTVSAVSAAWIRAMAAGQITGVRKRSASVNTQRNREAVMRLHVLPNLGSTVLTEITPHILGRMLQRVDDGGGPVDEVLKTFNGLWTFAEGRGLVDSLRPSTRFRPRQAKLTEPRALNDDELRSIWRAGEQLRHPFGSVVQLLMLTGQRRNEIGRAQWDWYDVERNILTVPTSAVKNRSGNHEVVLADVARAIIVEGSKVQRALFPKSAFIFTSTAGDTPISGWTTYLKRLEHCRKEAGQDPKPWRLHDLRHTFITRARLGDQNASGEVTWSAPLDVVQATVNHSLSEGVTGLYDHSDINVRYRIQKRTLANWWAAKLARIVTA